MDTGGKTFVDLRISGKYTLDDDARKVSKSEK